MVRDPLSDFLIRIKNAQAVGKESTEAPYTTFLWEVAKVLERTGYIAKIDRRGKRVRRTLEVGLAYGEGGRGRIDGVKRISRLSRRVYKKTTELHTPRNGMGLQIVSTSKGIMTDREARKAKLGGEILFSIW
ncbi:MAG: 30S ribosomal protein S8 [Patescibacteria group bacterium]